MGPDDPGIAEKTGFKVVEPLAKLKTDLATLSRTYKTFYTLMPPKDEDGYPHLTKSIEMLRADLPQTNLKDVTQQLDAMRQVKSAGELALLQKAIEVSIDAQLDAMKNMRPGLFEYQVAARMKEIHELGGCEREAYAPIVGTGFNSTVLHYSVLDAQIKDGDVVVMDVGGEYGGYAADITRTVPANGKFTPRQREIYDIVLGAQNAALAAVKPGAILFGGKGSLQQIVTDYIDSHGHDREGRTLGRYYPHGISHHLGLDVHDPGDRTRPLEPGMVVTVEPGIYIPEENLGVRIEDDVLVTSDGYKILTARLPRTADEIEKIMAEGALAAAKLAAIVVERSAFPFMNFLFEKNRQAERRFDVEIHARDFFQSFIEHRAVARFERHHEGQAGFVEAGLLQDRVNADGVFREHCGECCDDSGTVFHHETNVMRHGEIAAHALRNLQFRTGRALRALALRAIE